MSEHYGVPNDENIADTEWLELAGTSGWIVFMKDTRVRYNVAERESVLTHGVRCFCLSNQNLSADAMAARFLDNLEAIRVACSTDEPFIYAVHVNRIERLRLADA